MKGCPAAIMIEGEHYEVVDECVGEEETPTPAQTKPSESSTETGENKVENAVPNTEKKSTAELNSESVAEVISLDHLNEQKDMTDEDVLHHLDEIENIVLDPATFQIQGDNDQSSQENAKPDLCIPEERAIQNEEENRDTSNDKELQPFLNVKIKKEIDIDDTEENKWYMDKLAEKEAIIKERLSKVSRVLGISYPCYEKWVEWREKMHGSPLCKLKPARPCRLDKPYTNRWKFICSRKSVQKSMKKMDDPDTSFNKNIKTVWQLEATGAWCVNTNNAFEFPPFVLHAVKIFEEFLQTTETLTTQEAVTNVDNFSDDISIDVSTKKEATNEGKQQWLWLLVRCNSMDELMLFATGKNISRSTMDRLKQVYESGPGKDCNVKSLYCKSVNKCDNQTVTNTTFLVGSEALDEIVGGIKVQLAPKTNFWSNAAGAENVANAVIDLLAPTPKTTVVEIGCGIGLIGLMMASKCQQVIGVDSPSEVEEAEITCELNNIKNVSFITGSPSDVTSKIAEALKNRKASAVINANTNIGRAIEVMTCLRKIFSLKRIVMVTTLTKHSVRAILELARPTDRSYGNPFIPIKACVVDTLPVGPHFEAVIVMQRRMMNKASQPWFQKSLEESATSSKSKSIQEKIVAQASSTADNGASAKGLKTQTKKGAEKSTVKPVMTKKGRLLMAKKSLPVKNIEHLFMKNKLKGKRTHSPEKYEIPPKKLLKKFDKFNAKQWRTDLSAKKKKDWASENPQLRLNPLYEKKMREHEEQADLRERLSSNRIGSDVAQKVKEHQAILEIAKEKLSGPAPTVDVTTAKQLQNMLSMVLEQTNKLQSQLPRSVWDRIAPAETATHSNQTGDTTDESLLKGRYVQEMGSQDILITTANKKFVDNKEPPPTFKKYNNLPPLEPNMVMPVGVSTARESGPFQKSPDRYHGLEIRIQPTQGTTWSREKEFDRSRWSDTGSMRKPNSPTRRPMSPLKHHTSPPRRFSNKRPLLSPPRHPYSPPRRHISPLSRPLSPFRRTSPVRGPFSPQRRPMSPPRRTEISSMSRPMSPLRRKMSPMRSAVSPPRMQMVSPNRMISPSRQEMISPRRQMMPQERQHVSPMRHGGSQHRPSFGRPVSPPRRQPSPPRRQMSPPRRFNDEWDIPSRGAIEQNTWARTDDRIDNTWRSERPSTSNSNWEQVSGSDRCKTINEEQWASKDSARDDTWNSGGNTWSSKHTSTKPVMKETWSQGLENRWSNTFKPGTSNDNWNIGGKESFNAREEPWIDNNKQHRLVVIKDAWNQGDAEDWNDLPEDARDPWGDDANLDLKERWLNIDSTTSPSTWTRETDQGDSWMKQKDNWQNKRQSFGSKSQWQNNGSQITGESRWNSQKDVGKKVVPSSTWQSGSNSSWQPQNFNYQSQRPFFTNPYKDLR